MISRRKAIVGAAGVAGAAAGAALAGCGGGTPRTAGWRAAGAPISPSPSPSAAPVSFTVTPAADSTDVSPGSQVVVAVAGGTLQTVSVAAGGKAVAGAMDTDGHTWRSTDPLSYGLTYTVTASLADRAGTTLQKTSSFTTLKPASTASITFQANAMQILKTGGTYGVGQPAIVRFSRAVTDKAAAEKAIVVQTSPAVDGKFFWLDKQTVHWRPAQYWAKGTTVKVSVNALGVNLGGGVYGAANASTNFTIGRSLIAYADNNSHYTQVFIDGVMVRNMACSMGKGGYTNTSDGTQIHFWTQDGVHVVLEKDKTVNMTSSSYGITNKSDPNYYDEDVQLCTRISYSGEYLHAAPWNMADHGVRNSSHGCINLSPADAQWVYDTFLLGDVVVVKNSPKPLPVWDGLGDWQVGYDQY
jgi:lipoprotein-anchoring transpeptidase ErfK/SrfK